MKPRSKLAGFARCDGRVLTCMPCQRILGFAEPDRVRINGGRGTWGRGRYTAVRPFSLPCSHSGHVYSGHPTLRGGISLKRKVLTFLACIAAALGLCTGALGFSPAFAASAAS